MTDGNIVIEPKYRCFNRFSGGFVAVAGEVVIPPEYDMVGELSHGSRR